MGDPQPVVRLDYAPRADAAARRGGRWRVTVVACACLAAATCVAGTALIAFASVESVLLTGPVLLAAGLLMVVGGIRGGNPFAWCLGLSHCSVCTLFFTLVSPLGWGPSQAERPFLMMGTAYTPVAAVAFLLRHRS